MARTVAHTTHHKPVNNSIAGNYYSRNSNPRINRTLDIKMSVATSEIEAQRRTIEIPCPLVQVFLWKIMLDPRLMARQSSWDDDKNNESSNGGSLDQPDCG